jgi:transmembrane sensor
VSRDLIYTLNNYQLHNFMINKKEFLFLYQQFVDGKATSEEITLLNSYKDDIHLQDDEWTDAEFDKDLVYDMIWKKLGESRKPAPKTKNINNIWFKAAAILFIVTGIAGFFILSRKVENVVSTVARTQKDQIGGRSHQAVLTLDNGNVINLDSAKQGRLMIEGGVGINKASAGELVYQRGNGAFLEKSASVIWNTISTPRGGQYQVILSDGSRVLLNAASSLRFPVVFNKAFREVILSGEAYFEVTKDKVKPFLVTAGGAQVKVLGTHFNVNAYSGDSSVATTLLEGSVNFKADEEHSVRLLPGEQGVVSIGKSAIIVKKADMESVMAWKNGYFILNDTELAIIMKQIARWYDVQVDYQGDFHSKKFGGKISRYSNLSELLKDMEATGSVHFKLEGRRITVMP